MGAPFVWFDLTTTTSGDGEGVRDFYAQLFGWKIGPGMGDYQGFVTDGEQPWAGILPADAARAGRWIPYVVVDDLDAAAKQAIALGGSIVRDKTVGPAGTSIVVTDPGGAAVALFTPPPNDARPPAVQVAVANHHPHGRRPTFDDPPHADHGKLTQSMTGEELFWDLVEPMYANPAVQRSTMMGLPCVRLDGRFFVSLDRRTQALLVKLPTARVGELIADGVGEPFAPAGRAFREWVAIPQPDRERWQRLLTEARDHACPSAPRTAAAPSPRPRRRSARRTG